jgi:acetyl esterase
MKIKLCALLIILLFANTNYAQSNFPVIKASSTSVDIKEDGVLSKKAWVISAKEKLDVFKTSGKSVTFYTDIDSITFIIDSNVGEYDFVILLNGKDSAHTQIKYEAGYKQPKLPTAEDVKKIIEGQVYALKIAPENIYKVENKSVWNGTDSIKIRIYYPSANKKQRIVFNIHGGAFVAGDLNTHDNICRILANKTQSIVIALDYRKPPGNPFPAGINDCNTVLDWVKINAIIFGGDPNNIMLVGDSGGGLFVTALAVKLQKKLHVKGIVLVNPAVDLRNYEQGPFAFVTAWYLGNQNPDDSLASPATAKNFSFFPPTLIITSEKDPLKPQGVAFYNKLVADGIKVKTIDIPNAGHLAGYWAAGHEKANQAINETVGFILFVSNK